MSDHGEERDPVYTKLEPSVKDRWLEALRKKGYSQGKGKLKEDDNYCCLGVLCELMPDHQWTPMVTDDVDPMYSRPVTYYSGSDSEFPPKPVYDWANLDEDAAELLASQNDNGNTFPEIADWIEANL